MHAVKLEPNPLPDPTKTGEGSGIRALAPLVAEAAESVTPGAAAPPTSEAEEVIPHWGPSYWFLVVAIGVPIVLVLGFGVLFAAL